jgi:hypothetical protein
MSDTPETDDQPIIYALNELQYQILCVDSEFARKLERERDALREENNRLIELLRRNEKPIWMDGARSGAETGIDMAIKCIESLRESILEKLKEEGK